MKIVPAFPADAEAVRQIAHATIRAVYPHYYPPGAVDYFLKHHNAAAIERDIAENRVYLCISDGGEPAGTVTVSGSEIGRLFVLTAYQGRGYGGALLTFAENIIAEYADTAVLDVSFSAKAIYLKRGYEAVSWHVIETEQGDYLCYDEMSRRLKPVLPKLYQLVKMKNDRYAADGIRAGDVGTVLEIYDDIACEVEFSHPDGTTYALQAIRIQDLIILDENGGNPHDT